MARLEELFDRGTGDRCSKWRHYFEIYERYFAPFVGKKLTFLEIGTERGGFLRIAREYFGPQVRVVGVDLNPDCASLRSDEQEIYIGDQADAFFMSKIAQECGPFDIVVDDGGHVPDQQLTSFYSLFPHLNTGGVYLVEDLHTTFWLGYQNSRYGINFYDFAKGLVEKLTLFHVDQRLQDRYYQPVAEREASIDIDNFALKEIFGIHFYDSIIVFEKRLRGEPHSLRK